MPRLRSVFSLILVMGPADMLLRGPPDTEEPGLSATEGLSLVLKGVMDCETPEARVNCSLNSTLVRPFAAWGKGQGMCGCKEEKRGN
jgi:hypothetical protein